MNSTATDPIMVVENLSLFRNERPVLSNISTTLSPGELVALIGPNGAGKSTLLNVLSGELAPSQGQITLHGQPLHHYSVLDQARQRAVMSQNYDVAFPFTVEEIVAMGRHCWNRTPQAHQDTHIVNRMIEEHHLEPLRHTALPQISGGERQRTAFARVNAQNVPILFLDEPLSAMDIRHQEATMNRLRNLTDHGHTSLVVLHDLSTAAHYADRLLLLADGQLVAEGPPENICRAELLSQVYRTSLQVHHDDAGNIISIVPERNRRRRTSRVFHSPTSGMAAVSG